jgi:hypothetical protein
MRKQIVALLAGAMLMVATSAMALTINGGNTDVGVADTLLARTTLANSSDATELAWIKTILGSSVDWEIKTTVTSGNWSQTDQTGTWAYDLGTDPHYFMIKTGNNKPYKPLGADHFIFTNNNSLNWAVIDLDASFGEGAILANIGKISHVVELDGTNTPVPEPGTMMLLGIGMLGLAVYGKRRMNREA